MKKNKKLVIIVSVLLLGIGISLAYFLGKTLFTGDGATTKGTVATLNGATFTIEGELKFNDESIYPGHKTVSIIVGTATGDNVLIPYNIIWTGNNGLNTDLKYTVYKSSEKKNVEATCEKKTKVRNGKQYLNEDCNISNLEGLEKVNEGTIGKKTQETEVSIASEEFITATTPSTKVYYYVIIEYPNLDNDQYPEDIGKNFNGTLSAKLSEATADITITTIYQQQEGKSYKEVETIPDTKDYVLNEKSSKCSNSATPTWSNGLVVENLNKTGTECELYFDKKKTAQDTLASMDLEKNGELGEALTGPSCAGITCYNGGIPSMQQNGLYETEDDDGTSYIFRGTVSNNWVKFGKKGNEDIWWRIIRINGDGSIRLIYSGEGNDFGTTGNGKNIETTNTKYNEQYGDNTYFGYYTGAPGETDFAKTHSNATQSTIAKRTEKWFSQETNLNETTQLSHIDENAGFCNNRQISTNAREWWTSEGLTNRGTGTVRTAYKGWYDTLKNNESWRTDKQYPDLKCSTTIDEFENNADYLRDYYTWKGKANRGNKALTYPVGQITLDEEILAGGFGAQNNTGYWLYTGQYYWTMSPACFNGSSAYVFYLDNNGDLSYYRVHDPYPGVRPVINLKADTLFEPSNNNGEWGTKENPYVVNVD